MITQPNYLGKKKKAIMVAFACRQFRISPRRFRRVQDRLILNRYRPISQAGSGGYGTVQVAWDTRIQRRVAIKCMPLDSESPADTGAPTQPHLPVSYDAADMPGLDEARTAAMLSDANIVGVLDFEVQDDTAYLIMEYIDGVTLTQLLADCGDDIDLDIVGAVFQGVSHALEVAHGNQVLHLDIKPDNVLINRQGGVKVTDFGLSKLSGASGFGSAAGGTIGYMPPEQMRQEPLDARCDEWALASIAYEMISGENPFVAPDLDSAEAAIYQAELLVPSLCMEGLDSQADDVLFYALDPDRDERYVSVQDFAEEFQPFLGNPARGKKRLASLVGRACEDFGEEEEEQTAVDRLPVLDRVKGSHRGALMRIWSAAACAVPGFVATAHLPWFDGVVSLPFWGVLALIVLAAAIVPPIGAALVVLDVGVALCANGCPITGALFLAASAAWWFFVGRKGTSQADTALSPALFGAVGLGWVTPLLAGYLLKPKEAAINAGYGWLFAVVLTRFGGLSLSNWDPVRWWGHALRGEDALLTFMQLSSVWLTLACWVLAAVVLALFCIRGSRVLAFIGALISGALVVGTICLSTAIASSDGALSWMPSTSDLILALIPAIFVCILCCLGVPQREE